MEEMREKIIGKKRAKNGRQQTWLTELRRKESRWSNEGEEDVGSDNFSLK